MIVDRYFMFPETRRALIAESERRRAQRELARTPIDWTLTESQLRERKALEALSRGQGVAR